MAGAGSGTNLYNSELGKQMTNVGYDPNQMTAARGNLNQATGALSAYSDFANTGASKFGLNAGGFAAANAGALGGLNNNISAQQGVVNGLSDLYKTAQTGANQSAGLGVQGEQNTLGGYQKVYEDAANQRDQAASMMNFYDDLAQKQGGMNSSMANYYAQAQQSMAAAQQAMAQASYLASQTAGQNLSNQMTTNNMNSQQYKNYLAGKVDAQGKPINQNPAAASGGGSNIFSSSLNDWQHMALGADTVGKVGQGAKWVGNKIGGLF